MVQPAPHTDGEDDIDEVVAPVEHVSLSDAEFKVQLAQVIPQAVQSALCGLVSVTRIGNAQR